MTHPFRFWRQLGLLLLMVGVIRSGLGAAESVPSRLDTVLACGVVRVGTTGDFKPFTYRDPVTGDYTGFDIDAARALGIALGVNVEFVATTWPNLMPDLLADRYDIAVGGITRTLARRKTAAFTVPYFTVGKVPLVRKADAARLNSVAALNRASVKVGVNPGGTNEHFVRTYLPLANVRVVADNLAIPGLVAAGEVDVMITDNVEAVLACRVHPGLAAVAPDQPLTHDDFAYLVPRDDAAWVGWLDLWVDEMQRHGSYAALRARWIDGRP